MFNAPPVPRVRPEIHKVQLPDCAPMFPPSYDEHDIAKLLIQSLHGLMGGGTFPFRVMGSLNPQPVPDWEAAKADALEIAQWAAWTGSACADVSEAQMNRFRKALCEEVQK